MLTSREIRLIAEEVVKLTKPADRPMTLNAAADFLGISPEALRKKAERGQLPSHKKDGRIWFSTNELNEYLLES